MAEYLTSALYNRTELYDLDGSSEWYDAEYRSIYVEMHVDNRERFYATSRTMTGMWNTTVQNPYHGYLTIHRGDGGVFDYDIHDLLYGGHSTGSSSELAVGIATAQGGVTTASSQVIVSGSQNVRLTTDHMTIPVFEIDDEESIDAWVEFGDDSGALNYDTLHNTLVDYFLTNNGDRITLEWKPQEEDRTPKVTNTRISFHSSIPLTTDYVYLNNSDSYSTTWDYIQDAISGIHPDIVVDDLTVTIDILWNDEEVGQLKARIVKGTLIFQTICQPIVDESAGYRLFCATDNRYDDITTPTQDESDATGNDEDGSTFGGFDNLLTSYQISKQALSDLGSFIWKNSIFDDIKLLNNSPIENIVACHYMPCSICGSNANIVLGNVTTNVSGVKLSQNMIKKQVASFGIPRFDSTFLAYEPHTSISLFLPFVGMIALQPKDVCGYTVTIEYAFDVVCGSFGVMVYTSKGGGKTLIYSSQGMCAVTIPLTSSNQAQVQASILSSGVGLVGDAISKNVMGGATDLLNIATVQNHSSTFGSPSSMIGALSPKYCYYIARVPITRLPSNFAHTKGYICMTTYKMSELKGFTKLTNDVDLSGYTLTSNELERLRGILTSGFYL